MRRTPYTCKSCKDPVLYYDRVGMDPFICMKCVKSGEKKNAVQIKKTNALPKNLQAEDLQEVGEKIW